MIVNIDAVVDFLAYTGDGGVEYLRLWGLVLPWTSFLRMLCG